MFQTSKVASGLRSGQGIAPLKRIVQTLKKKKYAGPASFEMFGPLYQKMDPAEFAAHIKAESAKWARVIKAANIKQE